MQEKQVQSLGREDSLENEMATCSCIFAWETPQTEETGGLESMGSQSVGNPMDRGFWRVTGPQGCRLRHDLATEHEHEHTYT